MAKKQDVKIDDLVTVKPITDNQEVAFEAFKKENKELFLHGAAGTGKTFISLYPVSAKRSRSFAGANPSAVKARTMIFLSSPIFDLNWSIEKRLSITPSKSPAFSPAF